MSRTLFLGDSHTCGYESFPDGSYSVWNKNNYAEKYSDIENKPVLIYSESGVPFRMFIDWLTSMFQKYNDIDEVFLCLSPFNRFIIAYDDITQLDTIPVDHFMYSVDPVDSKIQRFFDTPVNENRLQLFQKTVYDDYNFMPDLSFTEKDGLTNPDIRKTPYMKIKTFFEMNTFLEKRDFLQAIYSWDNICHDNNAKLYLFNFRDRMIFPKYNNYYGKLKSTIISEKTVETFFREKNIEHDKYFLEDKEHYNETFHEIIATRFLPWLKNLKES